MRLSEAMMLGGMTNKLDWLNWRCCLLGVSVMAVGGARNDGNVEAESRWPWINGEVLAPAWSCVAGEKRTFRRLISEAARLVQTGMMSLETIVEWVRENEPVETEPAEPDSSDAQESILNEEVGTEK